MDKHFEDFVRVWYEDNGRIGELIDRVYKTGYEHGKTECHQKPTSGDGLSGVTKEQVKRFLDDCCPELRADLPTLAVALTEFFNDPNRQIPPGWTGEYSTVVDGDPEDSVLDLQLDALPDYETWFEAHGSDRAFPFRPQDAGATVHELYTHFRARLLDELRQAGVIGDD